jgi:inosine-uridine nucleoside N-ribohydrolase
MRSLVLVALLLAVQPVRAAPVAERLPRFVIDADTANEVDDPYAIVRALIEPSIQVVGLASAQWQNSHWATPDTLEDSQRLNEVLLGYLDHMDLPHPRGAHARLFDWGEDLAQHSAAADFVIDRARRTPAGEKLGVIVLGASTNVASALLMAPEIRSRIRVFMLGTGYDAARGVWTKLDFNCINDERAVSVLFGADGLELHVMPHTTAAALTVHLDDVRRRFAGRSALHDFLVRRWEQHADSGRYTRVIWDLALVEAVIRPTLARQVEAKAPPEDGERLVSVYTSIDADGMRADFFDRLLAPGSVQPAGAR